MPPDPALPPISADASGPAFREPWEAQAFALVTALHEAGHFTRPEWVAAISAEIRQAQAALCPRRVECAANLNGRHDYPARREPLRIG